MTAPITERPVSRLDAARWLGVLLAVLALHSALYLFSEYSTPDDLKSAVRLLYETASFLPLQVGATIALVAASRRAALPPGTRLALRWTAAGFATLVIGSIISITSRALGKPLPYVSWADVVYVQLYPCVILGMRALPSTRGQRTRVRDTLDTIVVLTAFGALIAFATAFEATTTQITPLGRAVTVLYSTLQMIALLSVNRAVERANRIPSARAVQWLFVALAMSVTGDLVFQLMYSTGYRGVNWSRAEAVLTNLLVMWSCICFLKDTPPVIADKAAPEIPFSPLPILAVTAVALMLVWMARRDSVRGLLPLVAGLVVLNAALVLRDILASRSAALSLREDAERAAQRRLDALVRHSSDTILLVDANMRLLFASAAATTLFGITSESLIGQPLWPWVLDTDRDAFAAFLARIQLRSAVPDTMTWHLKRRDGSARAVESIGLDLLSETSVLGIVLNSRDVTDRIALEDRLRQAQKLEVAGRLAGGVAHDFNNVLSTIVAGSELAQLSLEPGHEAQRDLDEIRAAAQRGAALTRRLLAFVRNEPAKPQSVKVEHLLRELEPLLRRLVGDPVTLSVHVAPACGYVCVDRAELEHILFNLVSNARDSMPRGGVISVAASMVDMDGTAPDAIIAPSHGRYIELSVEDEGSGMSDDARLRMFDPFFTSKSEGRGTGLGLIGVKPLVESAGGGLLVKTQQGVGTRVAMLLPALDSMGDGTVDDVRVSDHGNLVANILLIEDEGAVRDNLERLLRSRGATVRSASAAADARLLLASGQSVVFDAVVCDVMMPGETGVEFATWLRGAHATLPILMISGHTGALLDRAARASQDFELLRKPFSGDDLVDRLRALLPERQQQDSSQHTEQHR